MAKVLAVSKADLSELQAIISKMSLQMCCVAVLPEFDLKWREVSQAVRNNRLPMNPSSVARVLRQHAKTLPIDDVEEILDRLRLKLISVQHQTWHALILTEQVREESPAMLARVLASRIAHALKQTRAGKVMRPSVQTLTSGELIYASVQLVSETRRKAPLFVAVALGQPVIFVSSISATPLLRATVEGLGYESCEDAQLFGPDIMSLLQIYNLNYTDNVNHLTEMPEYNPMPVITENGIDYTYKEYDEKYVESLIGPSPPLRTELIVESEKSFFDPLLMNKKMKMTMKLKCENVGEILKAWVAKKGLAPNSHFFHTYLTSKSNVITCTDEWE